MGWEPLPGHREPVGLDDSLGRLRKLLGTPAPDGLVVLREHWEQVIGVRLAAHCRLHSLHGGTLVVSTSEPAVAEQLRWMETDLVAAANAVLGDTGIDSVRVVGTEEGDDSE